MCGERVMGLGVDQLGQSLRIGFVADVPGLQPRQPCIGSARAGLRHFAEAKVDRIGQDCGQQQRLILGYLAGLQMGEVTRKAGPRIHFQQQFRDLDVREHQSRLIDQLLRCLWHGRIKRRDLQARIGDAGIGQLVRGGQVVDRPKLLLKQGQATMQVFLAAGSAGKG